MRLVSACHIILFKCNYTQTHEILSQKSNSDFRWMGRQETCQSFLMGAECLSMPTDCTRLWKQTLVWLSVMMAGGCWTSQCHPTTVVPHVACVETSTASRVMTLLSRRGVLALWPSLLLILETTGRLMTACPVLEDVETPAQCAQMTQEPVSSVSYSDLEMDHWVSAISTWTPSHSFTTVSLTCACLGAETKSCAAWWEHMSAHAKLQMSSSTPGVKTPHAVSFQDLAQTQCHLCFLNLLHFTRRNQNDVFQISIQGTIRHSGKKVVDICVHHITPLSSMYLKPHVDWLK